MPFADDVRNFPFPSLETLINKKGEVVKEHPYLPTEEQMSAMEQFVDAMDREVLTKGAHPGLYVSKTLNGAGAFRRPHHVGELAKDAVEVEAVRLYQAVAEQVEAQVGVGNRLGSLIEIDLDRDDRY